MDKILIRCAEQSDAADIYEFKTIYFDKANPIELAYPIEGRAETNIQRIIDAITHGVVLMAIEKETSKLVGFLAAAPIDSSYIQKTKDLLSAESFNNQKLKDIYNFFVYVEEKADLFGKFDVDVCFQIQLASVHPDHQGQKIATKLFQSILNVASLKKYKLISVDCSSAYTSKISENFGMDCIASVSYQEYNDHVGKVLFKPVEPHTEIKVYAKRL